MNNERQNAMLVSMMCVARINHNLQHLLTQPYAAIYCRFYTAVNRSWLGRLAGKYSMTVEQLWTHADIGPMPALTRWKWLLFPPVPLETLERLSQLTHLSVYRLSAMQTPIGRQNAMLVSMMCAARINHNLQQPLMELDPPSTFPRGKYTFRPLRPGCAVDSNFQLP